MKIFPEKLIFFYCFLILLFLLLGVFHFIQAPPPLPLSPHLIVGDEWKEEGEN